MADFWSWLFPRRGQPKGLSLSQATDVVSAYGKVLAASREMVLDAEDLPYAKDVIKAAILIVLRSKIDSKMREHLRTAYVSLGTYQKLTPKEKVALRMWRKATDPSVVPSSREEVLASAEAISKYGSVVSELQGRVNREMELLLSELKAEGF